MLKQLLVAGVVASLAIPLAVAHVFPFPSNTPGIGTACAPQHDHHYVAGTSVATGGLVSATWRTTVVLTDSCEFQDGEGDFGIGGGFLPADHHDAYTGVCVTDALGQVVGFWIGAKGASGGIVNVSPLQFGCGAAFDANQVPIKPGVDGGWWIFLANTDTSTFSQPGVTLPTQGHICSAPFWAC